MSDSNYELVADLGGTNIRFGLVQPGSTAVTQIKKYCIRDYESVSHLLQVYLRDCGLDRTNIEACCFAIAGPIDNQVVKMTNCDWEISANGIGKALQGAQATLINDFEAVAHSVVHIPDSGMLRIGEQDIDRNNGPISVFGPGTGLGAALLVPAGKNTFNVIATEGGHAGLSARTEEELKIFHYWRNKGCRINREFFVSGTGIERIFEALCAETGSDDYRRYSVAQIQQQGCNGDDPLCQQAMNIFCAFLGSAAGDQALCTGSTGGLVLAGGVLPKFVEFLQESPFRKRFESKGVMSEYNKKIATALIIEDQPGLIGAAAFLLER